MDLEILYKFFFDSGYDASKPSFSKVLENNIGTIILVATILIAMAVGLYAIGQKIFGKKNAWKAIVPFYGFFELFKAVELNPFISVAIWVPIVGIIPLALFNFSLPKAFGQKIDFQVLNIFFPFVIYNMLGFDIKYEYQYVKGKNIAFQNEFRTVMPEELTKDALTPASSLNGAAVASMMTAKESTIARASAEQMEKTAEIRRKQEEEARIEAEKKAAEEAAKKAAKINPDDFNYDVFDEPKEEFGPESVTLNFKVQTIGGKFQSAAGSTAEIAKPNTATQPATSSTTEPTPTTSPASTTSPAAAPVSIAAPVAAATPVAAPTPAPAITTPQPTESTPVTQPVVATPVAPAPAATPEPVAPVVATPMETPIATTPATVTAPVQPAAPVQPTAPVLAPAPSATDGTISINPVPPTA